MEELEKVLYSALFEHTLVKMIFSSPRKNLCLIKK